MEDFPPLRIDHLHLAESTMGDGSTEVRHQHGRTFSATAHVWRTGNAPASPRIPRPRTTTTEHTCVSGRFVVQPPIGQGRSMAINPWIPPDVFGILEHRHIESTSTT
jgi:hypothetical protein